MAVMNVNPTRMELTNLKKKLVTARRGHKLLKDKRDELMRQFLDLVRENKELRKKVEAALIKGNEHMALSCSSMSDEELDIALMMPSQKITAELKEKNIMSVIVPEYDVHFKSGDEGDIYSYGFAFTSADLDEVTEEFSSIVPDMIRLAQIEKACQLLSLEIEKTRRRVNALEYVMIPDYEDTIKYITMKIEEADRSNTTRLLKIKDMLLRDAHDYSGI